MWTCVSLLTVEPRGATSSLTDAPGAPGALVCKGSSGMGKRRLDALLAERGLFSSRSRAAASVMAGEVRVGAAERRAVKPGEMVDVQERVSVDERPQFVSRGGIKLANALDRKSTRLNSSHLGISYA